MAEQSKAGARRTIHEPCFVIQAVHYPQCHLGNRSRWSPRRDAGPHAGPHLLWRGYSTGNRCRPAGPKKYSQRGGHLYSGRPPPLFIALSAAAIYYAVSRKLSFLVEHALICGLFFGAAVELVMTLIVLPLSALHASGPYQYRALVLGLVVHMFLVGLPISFSVQRFARQPVSG